MSSSHRIGSAKSKECRLRKLKIKDKKTLTIAPNFWIFYEQGIPKYYDPKVAEVIIFILFKTEKKRN